MPRLQLPLRLARRRKADKHKVTKHYSPGSQLSPLGGAGASVYLRASPNFERGSVNFQLLDARARLFSNAASVVAFLTGMSKARMNYLAMRQYDQYHLDKVHTYNVVKAAIFLARNRLTLWENGHSPLVPVPLMRSMIFF